MIDKSKGSRVTTKELLEENGSQQAEVTWMALALRVMKL